MVRIATIRAVLLGSSFLVGTALSGCGGTPELFGGGDFDAGPQPGPDADASGGNIIIARPDTGPKDVSPGDCTPISCSGAGVTYCGKIGNGCGGTLDCGDCTGGQNRSEER